MPYALAARFMRSLSGAGLILGVLFFAAALTPTLVPRTATMQGVLSGGAFAVGYLIGVFLRWLWTYLELPAPADNLRQKLNGIVLALSVLTALWFLWRAAEWQNSIRRVMGMEPVDTSHPVLISLIAIATFLMLLVIGRLFALLARRAAWRIAQVMPPRVANVLGVTLAVLVFWLLASDVFWRMGFDAIDASFREYDALIDAARPQPAAPEKSGSPASLIDWQSIGRAGREFISSGPDAATISAFTGRPAKEPIRVYVGLKTRETAEERAELALQELLRVGAFERELLVVAVPTGTGWLDPAAMDSLEYLHHGDVATVAIQYSYLNSPLSLIVEPDRGEDAAKALLSVVYRHWTSLPRDRRPRLYLHGLSLGALNSQGSVDLFRMLGDPVNGALWSGPPFASELWATFTAERDPGSPAWLPQYQDGSVVRFMNQNGYPEGARYAPWGAMRIVYLQYASDSVTFFSPLGFFRKPSWMDEPRGPDVSPDLRWYPVVTMLQLALDMAFATATPLGHGHLYAPEHYVTAWIEVTEPQGWNDESIARLKQHLRSLMEEAVESIDDPEDAYSNQGG
ncbi:alpha/beta-hydrolase family protein [Chelativorans composti]|uniref:Alpha/beta hydrolase n=1 Tax=Chelativorans composti TaxID=768533 RepID=A0ABW5DLU7_9HYPH